MSRAAFEYMVLMQPQLESDVAFKLPNSESLGSPQVVVLVGQRVQVGQHLLHAPVPAAAVLHIVKRSSADMICD